MFEKLQRIARSPWLWTLGSYVAAQALIALASIFRIPALVDSLSADGYGIFVAVSSAWPVAAILIDGIQQVARTHASGAPLAAGIRGRQVSRIAKVEATGLVVIAGILATAALLLLQTLGTFQTTVTEILTAVALTVIVAVATLPFATSRGVLDATGHPVLANLAFATTAVVGLPLLLIGLSVSPTVPMAVFLAALGSALPYFAAALFVGIIQRKAPPARRWSPVDGGWRVPLPLWGLTASMTLFAGANALAYALDPVWVALFLSPVDAGAYGLASRVMMIAMFVPIGIAGLLTSRIVKLRNTLNSTALLAWILKASGVFAIVGVAFAGAGLAFGPSIGQWLSEGEVPTPFGMYLAQALFALASTASAPLMAALTTPQGARFRSILLLLATAVNIPLSIALTVLTGIAGPSIASTIVILLTSLTILVSSRRRPQLYWTVRSTNEDG